MKNDEQAPVARQFDVIPVAIRRDLASTVTTLKHVEEDLRRFVDALGIEAVNLPIAEDGRLLSNTLAMLTLGRMTLEHIAGTPLCQEILRESEALRARIAQANAEAAGRAA